MRVLTTMRLRRRPGNWSASETVKTRPPVAAARRSRGSRAAASSTSSEVWRGVISSVASGRWPAAGVQGVGQLRRFEANQVAAGRERRRGRGERARLPGNGLQGNDRDGFALGLRWLTLAKPRP